MEYAGMYIYYMYGHLVHYTDAWYILLQFWYIFWLFGICFPVWQLCLGLQFTTTIRVVGIEILGLEGESSMY
jgi:hypothetical protein